MSPQPSRWLVVAALLSAAGVGLGAFGAHGLEDRLAAIGYAADDVARRTEIFETATRYQLLHSLALALIALAWDQLPGRAVRSAAWCFLAGIAIFSGLLYALTFTGPDWRWLGAVVPIGGVALIAGWVALAIAAWRRG
jgi:uncharacterized membrane protein YgdD (TMEM256/DUF423 family)